MGKGHKGRCTAMDLNRNVKMGPITFCFTERIQANPNRRYANYVIQIDIMLCYILDITLCK